MRKIVILAMVVFLVMGLAGLGLAGSQKVQAKPFIFDPEDTGVAVAAWVTHQGLPDAGKSAHALMLQIDPPVVGIQAGVAIKGVKGLTLTELGFDIQNDGLAAQTLRFEVALTAGGTVTLPLTAIITSTPIPDTDWTSLRFDLTNVIGSVQTVRIIFEEEGSVLLDNIDVNGALMGKPGNAKIKVGPKGKKEK